MTRQKWIILVVTLGLIGGTAGALVRLKANQRLGLPGIKTSAIPDSARLNIYLPELVLDYKSEPVEMALGVLSGLPQDSSFCQRRYQAPDGFQTLINVVLMGTDRTCIHKPQFCLKGAGWTIYKTSRTTVSMKRPYPYELEVNKLLTTRSAIVGGQPGTANGVYVYWFVADDQLTAGEFSKMWSTGKELLRTGALERWAYITCFSVCRPGEEDATYERMQKFIQASVPQFQLVPRERHAGTAITQTASK